MMPYETVIFDLDGTISNPRDGIIQTILEALARLGIEEENPARLEAFIGPPFMESLKKTYGLDDTQANEAIRHYQERYPLGGMFDNRIYPGIPKLLIDLHRAGARLVLATGQLTAFGRRILRHFRLEQYFSLIAGSTLDGIGDTKIEVIGHALAQCPGLDPSRAIMIGDRKFDIQAAHELGLDSLGVTYGFGSVEEMRQARPTWLAHSVEDLRRILLPVSCRTHPSKPYAVCVADKNQ